MLCYKDRSFCSAKCITPDCPDAITPDVIEAATKWSASFGFDGALISSMDMSARCEDFTPAVGSDA